MREQGSGHIVQVSSIGGVAAFPSLGIYHASKWALEGLTEALAGEVAVFGIRTTLIEPGGYATDWGTASAVQSKAIPVYAPIRDAMAARAGGPAPTAQDSVGAVLAAVDAEEPPTRLLLSSQAYDTALHVYDQRVQTWKAWEQTSRSADKS
jgi:NAD(P)-dependent dehydrogenase (short-subunit alcohol dehydrogenase family)